MEKYNLFDDVKKTVEASTSHVYQNKFSVTSTQPIVSDGSKFKVSAYSAKSLNELVASMSKIVAGVKSPIPVGTELENDLAEAVLEGHYGIYSVLLQTYAFLCKESGVNAITLAKAKVTLEQQMIGFALNHPLNVRGEGEVLQDLQVFRKAFYDYLIVMFSEAREAAIKEANKPVPKVVPKAAPPKDSASAQDKPAVAEPPSELPSSGVKSVMLTIVESAVDIEGDPFVVIEKLSSLLQRGIADQFMHISKLPKDLATQAPELIQKINSAKNMVLKQLAREQAIGLLKDPSFFIQYELECVTYEGESTTGARRYTIDLAPGETREILVKTSTTSSEERKSQSSIVDNTSDTAEESFEKELTNEAKASNKSHADVEEYMDKSKSASLGAYADVYLDITTKIVEAGCSGGITYDTDESTDWGGSTSIGSSLETAKENTFRAMEKQNHSACNNRTVTVAESTVILTTTVSENWQKIMITNPNKFSPISIGVFEVKTMYHSLMSAINVNLWFGNGIQWRKIDMARLDSELNSLLSDASEITRIKNLFKASLVILDYQNRPVSIVDPSSKFYRVNTTPYSDILKSNNIPLTKSDKEWDNREVSGVLIGMRNFVTTQSGTLMVGSVGKPLADRVLCRTWEQILEGTDCDVTSKDIKNSASRGMAKHCEKLSTQDNPTASDAYFKLFGGSAADIVGKMHILHQIHENQPKEFNGADTVGDEQVSPPSKKKKKRFKSE